MRSILFNCHLLFIWMPLLWFRLAQSIYSEVIWLLKNDGQFVILKFERALIRHRRRHLSRIIIRATRIFKWLFLYHLLLGLGRIFISSWCSLPKTQLILLLLRKWVANLFLFLWNLDVLYYLLGVSLVTFLCCAQYILRSWFGVDNWTK